MFNVNNLESQYIIDSDLKNQIIKTDIKIFLNVQCRGKLPVGQAHTKVSLPWILQNARKKIKIPDFSHNNMLLSTISWKSGANYFIDRDIFIGWDTDSRKKNIDHIVSNTRFVIC